MVLSHREHMVETHEIEFRDAPRAQEREVVSAFARSRHGALIRRIADVVAMGARRIEFEVLFDAKPPRQVACHSLGRG